MKLRSQIKSLAIAFAAIVAISSSAQAGLVGLYQFDDAGNLFVNVNVEALNQGHYGDKGRDPDDHAKQSQRRAQLVRPDCRHCNFQYF